MPVKFHCPKCGKRYVDWGAEKIGFKCPDCKDEALVKLTGANAEPTKRPVLKRRRKAEDDEAMSVFAPYEAESEELPDTGGVGASLPVEGAGLDTFAEEEVVEADDAAGADFDAEPAEAGEDVEE